MHHGVSHASDVTRYKVVDGIGIYLGVVPTDLIMKHPMEHTERAMHGGVPLGKHHHHVMVALFESKTGDRLAGHTKELEPMTIAGTVTYGNYFDLGVSGVYRILVRVRSPGLAHIIEAEFEYKHHR